METSSSPQAAQPIPEQNRDTWWKEPQIIWLPTLDLALSNNLDKPSLAYKVTADIFFSTLPSSVGLRCI